MLAGDQPAKWLIKCTPSLAGLLCTMWSISRHQTCHTVCCTDMDGSLLSQWNLLGLRQGSTKTHTFLVPDLGNTCPKLTQRSLWDGRHKHKVGIAAVTQVRSEPKVIFQTLAFHILNNNLFYYKLDLIIQIIQNNSNAAISRKGSLPWEWLEQSVIV